MRISPEKSEKLWADAFYEAGIELAKRGRVNDSKCCFAAAYSLYKRKEDLEGTKKCKSSAKFSRGLERGAFDMGKNLYENIIAKFEAYVKDNASDEEIIEDLKRACLESLLGSEN